jgi:hypothetical protein
MVSELVGQFLKSSDGSGLLQDLVSKGLSAQQATQAVTATAEGAVEHGGGAGLDLAGLAGGLLGGAGGSGGLGGLLGGMLGGGAGGGAGGTSAAAGPLAALISPVSQFVAQKTGLAPAMAEMVVSAALPKLLALLTSATGVGAGPGTATAGAPASASGEPASGSSAVGDLFSPLLR